MKFFVSIFVLALSFVQAAEFTVASYNCGGLSDHYDYIREVAMQKVMQERYTEEPLFLSRIEKAEKIALKRIFAPDEKVQNEWHEGGYSALINDLVQTTHGAWFQRSEALVTSYRIRPIAIKDEELQTVLFDHIDDLLSGQEAATLNDKLELVRSKMAKRIFQNDLGYDVICLQEADYLYPELFPRHYDFLFAQTEHSVNGVLWNKERFSFVEKVYENDTRTFAVELQDLETGEHVIVGSGHLTGCNPFVRVGKDSECGDKELESLIQAIDERPAVLKIIGMDANVTAFHPRLTLLKEASYTLDSENFIEPTCTNPNSIVDTRIDWIAVKALQHVTIVNIPVKGVPLNNLRANISDHKPIAARIAY